MRTFDELLSAAGRLSPMDLSRLRSEIERLDKLANAIVLETHKGITFRLCRLTDGEYIEALDRSLAIQDDYSFYLELDLRSWQQPEEELNLAEVYLTLKHLAGESSRRLDDYKSAFSFPFALDVMKGNDTFAYVLDVLNIRESLYYRLRKIVAEDDPRLEQRQVHPPLEDEFSQEEIRFLISYFRGYLIGRWETLDPEQVRPFVRPIQASLMIFGYCGGEAFQKQYDSEAEYQDAWRQLARQVEQESASRKQANSCIVIEKRPRSDNSA